MSLGTLGHTARPTPPGQLALSRTRTCLLALTCFLATAAALWAGALLWSGAGATPGSFEWLLGAGAIAPLLGGCSWLSLVACALVFEAFTQAPARSPRWIAAPAALRALVLASTGAALVVGAAGSASAVVEAGPAHTVPTQSGPSTRAAALDGLQLPTRAQGSDRRPQSGGEHVVRRGDSLWSISRARHPEASDALLLQLVEQLHRLNRDVIGPDPDLVQPGMTLRFNAAREGAIR